MSATLSLLEEKLGEAGIPPKAVPIVTKAVAEWLDSMLTDPKVREQILSATIGEFDTPLAAYWSKNTLVGLHRLVLAGR